MEDIQDCMKQNFPLSKAVMKGLLRARHIVANKRWSINGNVDLNALWENIKNLLVKLNFQMAPETTLANYLGSVATYTYFSALKMAVWGVL